MDMVLCGNLERGAVKGKRKGKGKERGKRIAVHQYIYKHLPY